MAEPRLRVGGIGSPEGVALEDETGAEVLRVSGGAASGRVLDDGGREFNVQNPRFGARGDGATVDTAAIQAAVDAAGRGRVYFPPGRYMIDRPILIPSGQTWEGAGGGQFLDGQSEIRATPDFTGDAMVQSIDTDAFIINISINEVALHGGFVAPVILDLTNVGYSTFHHSFFGGCAEGGACVLLDSKVNGKCYFNLFIGCKADGDVGLRFQRGANCNQWIGGRLGNASTCVEFLSLSSANVIMGADMEIASVRHVLCDAPSNKLIGNHFETAPIGIEITERGSNTVRIGNDFASQVLTAVVDDSNTAITHEALYGERGRWKMARVEMQSDWSSSTTPLDIDPLPYQGDSNAFIRLFRRVTTTGRRLLDIYRGDGSSQVMVRIDADDGSVRAERHEAKRFELDNAAGAAKSLHFQTQGTDRWIVQTTATPESGGNEGSDFAILARSDAGGSLGPAVSIKRSSRVATFSGRVDFAQQPALNRVEDRGSTANRPSSPVLAQCYYDTTLGRPIWYNGSEWIDASGSAV